MIKLLIVDDEALIREGLSKTIPWEDLGIEVKGTAQHGYEALDILEKEYVDLVLTDIRMPGMDGLELIQELNKRSYDLLCVILTGYGEFEYAQRALKLGAYDFILKPTKEEELLQVMRRAVEDIKQSRQNESDYFRLMMQRFLHNEEKTVEIELRQKLDFKGNYAIVCVANGHLSKLSESIPGITNHFNVESTEEHAVILLYNIPDHHTLKQKCEDILQNIIPENNRAMLGVSMPVSTISELPRAYRQAKLVQEKRINNDSPGLQYYSDLEQVDMTEVVTYIDNHFSEPITLNDLAREHLLSNSYFSRLFKQYTGSTFIDYVTKKRMEKAKYLLTSTNLRPSEIAFQTGYQNPRYFSQTFKKWTGMTPTEYKAKINAN